MQKDQNLHNETIDRFSNFGEELLDWKFLDCADEFSHDQHVAGQHEHDVYDEDAEYLPAMWKNWLNITSEAQSLDDVFGVSSSACISPLPSFSSQTSANFVPHDSYTRGPGAIETCFNGQPSPLSSTTLPNYVGNEHDLRSLYEKYHVNEQSRQLLNTGIGSVSNKSAAPYPSPPDMNMMAPLSPPPVDVKATARLPLSYLKAKSSSYKKKPAEVARNFRNHGVGENEEAEICLADSIKDGYVWHKYGQKSIKNKMHPRGYFKCAHPNCSVKKRTELAPDMRGLLSITYIGKHNHLRRQILMKHREVR